MKKLYYLHLKMDDSKKFRYIISTTDIGTFCNEIKIGNVSYCPHEIMNEDLWNFDEDKLLISYENNGDILEFEKIEDFPTFSLWVNIDVKNKLKRIIINYQNSVSKLKKWYINPEGETEFFLIDRFDNSAEVLFMTSCEENNCLPYDRHPMFERDINYTLDELYKVLRYYKKFYNLFLENWDEILYDNFAKFHKDIEFLMKNMK